MRFKHDTVEHYGNGGGTGYFSLKNNKDTAQVRFMYNSIEDVEGYSVHQVQVGDRQRYVNCLREYNDPKDACPFCAANQFARAKMFIPLYNVDEGQVQLWERGKRFFAEISSLCARYANGVPLVSQVFEIERRGEKGDTNTTYGIFPIGQPDDTELADLPEIPDIVGGIVLDKSADDMEYYLRNGKFPDDAAQGGRNEMPIRRRTPASSGRDVY